MPVFEYFFSNFAIKILSGKFNVFRKMKKSCEICLIKYPASRQDHSADILRRSLRSPTMMRLQESLSSVNVASNGLNNGKTSGDKDENSRDEYDDPSGSMTSSRCGTPKPFNCRVIFMRVIITKIRLFIQPCVLP